MVKQPEVLHAALRRQLHALPPAAVPSPSHGRKFLRRVLRVHDDRGGARGKSRKGRVHIGVAELVIRCVDQVAPWLRGRP